MEGKEHPQGTQPPVEEQGEEIKEKKEKKPVDPELAEARKKELKELLAGKEIQAYLLKYINKYHSPLSYIADDIVQTVLLKALNPKNPFNGESNPKTWILAIARNTCLEKARTRKKQIERTAQSKLLDLLEDESPKTQLEQGAFTKEQKRILLQAIEATLRVEDKLIMMMFYNDGKTSKEISEILDITPVAVRQRLNRARKEIKKYIKTIEKGRIPLDKDSYIEHYPEKLVGHKGV